MKLSTLFVITVLAGFTFSHSTTFNVVNSGLTFSPATTTIHAGDTVMFTLASVHNAQEVSQATWNANGTTLLAGGFSVPFGGGRLVGVAVGTHYFVCATHAPMGMKGQIIVSPPSTAIPGPDKVQLTDLSRFSFQITDNGVRNVRMIIQDMMGREVWQKDFPLAKSRVVSWDGTGIDGQLVTSGNYLIRMLLSDDANGTVREIDRTVVVGR